MKCFSQNVFAKYLHPERVGDNSNGLGLAELLVSCESVCTMHSNELKGSIILHGPQILQIDTGIEQLANLVGCVKKVMWPKVLLFLESGEASFLSICEDRHVPAWQRHLISVSLYMDKFFEMPGGKSVSPFKYNTLKCLVEETLGPLRKFLDARSLSMSSCAVASVAFSFASG